ncbi:Glycosyltransferase involved in cell wall bisynthesis [Klenkia marina]|uniref:Glycosyltransferase involved in cell wall bisynthesis n=1 Tax=Klenkia marina TaxID=1960309 RepID=A0A1G4XUD0_9ACTN|nr:glycosyltransferase [Klenkia marina]SCX44630.1 Glycosyltransferase involved in cell wall bisynthesis [Klenkia marina]
MTTVLVPAYRPDGRLPALLSALRRLDPHLDLLVVDDGSPGPVLDDCRALGATVLHHGVNRGKGAALRSGFAHVALVSPGSAVVTADADGQHLPEDVVRVARAVPAGTGTGGGIVLGVRSFGGDDVPLRSRVGNRVSAVLVRAATGRALADTQTGLRGFAPDLLPWLLDVTGDRFEYELRVLLEAARRGTPIDQVPIATVYLEGNASSHFSPVRDSLRVYRPLALFLLSSLSAFAVDLVALLVLGALTGSLWVSVVGARLLSGTVNFQVNRRVVFSAPRSRRSLLGYVALAGVLLGSNLALISALTWVGVPLLAAKLTTEVTLVAVSFTVQRCAVFRRRRAVRSLPAQPVILQRSGRGVR